MQLGGGDKSLSLNSYTIQSITKFWKVDSTYLPEKWGNLGAHPHLNLQLFGSGVSTKHKTKGENLKGKGRRKEEYAVDIFGIWWSVWYEISQISQHIFDLGWVQTLSCRVKTHSELERW